MKARIAMLLVALACAGAAKAQLVVFDNSHSTNATWYSDFQARLATWGYTVEARTTSLMDSGDADVIVILPEDAFLSDTDPYTPEEAAWLMDYVNRGGGLLAAVCPNDSYWAQITEIMDVFGISEANTATDPVHYDVFAPHPIFDGVTELGDDFIYCTSLTASGPSSAVGGDGSLDYIAVYQPLPAGTGGAVWVSEYYMMHSAGLDDYDNAIFLQNTMAWLSSGSTSTAESSWSAVKALY